MCFDCDYWQDRVENQNSKSQVVIDQVVFQIGPKGELFKGCSGKEFTIKRSSGEIVVTNNLWVNGRIPNHFKDLIADNATFVEEAKEDVGF